jgi:hypothetical protein
VIEAAPVVEPEPAPEPTPEPVAALAVEPTPEPDVEPEPEDAGVAVDEGVEQLASLAEQVIYEAEAIAGEAAHNFQVALKAATGAQGVVPTLNGINSYLHRSVQINSQFVEQFATVRSPVDLVQLQMRFLEEHRLAMLEFAQQWMVKKPASELCDTCSAGVAPSVAPAASPFLKAAAYQPFRQMARRLLFFPS